LNDILTCETLKQKATRNMQFKFCRIPMYRCEN